MQKVKPAQVGSLFEQLFFRAAVHNKIGILRIPNGCKSLGLKKIIRIKSPCDFVLAHKGRCALIDTKSQGTGLTFPKANINMHQVMSINYMVNHGAVGGYIVFFREIDLVVFFDSEQLRTAESGLGFGKGLNLGSIDELNLKRIFE